MNQSEHTKRRMDRRPSPWPHLPRETPGADGNVDHGLGRRSESEPAQGDEPNGPGGFEGEAQSAEGALPPGARPGTREAGRARETVSVAPRDVVSLEQVRARRALGSACERRPSLAGDIIVDTVRAAVRDELAEVRAALEKVAAAGDAILTMEETAKFLRVSTKTVLDWIRGRGLPASRAGAQWRFRRSEVVLWIERQNDVQ